MALSLAPGLVVGVALVVLVAGAVNGVAGFGFAVVGTMALATVLDPTVAVVFMIVPILVVNVSLVRELSPTELRTCSRRFGPLLAAALLGTVLGMVVLDRLPEAPLRVGLGLVALAFVLSVHRRVPTLSALLGRATMERPGAMVLIGGLSGVLFGGTNVGVQLVAYIRSFDLTHGLFVGVVALVFLGLSAIRVAAAGALGLYPDATVALASLAAGVPAAAGVAVGRRLRSRIGDRLRQTVVLGLLTVIGVRLVASGLGVL
ncbi:TSUP family transporter [Haloarcula pelagica]|uniref:TSUP family transporter n=1 Tax=Haloarcula pelagica TaxID=3033389 RepID=UPI0024C2F520|nr:TSUP family transporter [Halomicroarcula sp. YJ-61-S]